MFSHIRSSHKVPILEEKAAHLSEGKSLVSHKGIGQKSLVRIPTEFLTTKFAIFSPVDTISEILSSSHKVPDMRCCSYVVQKTYSWPYEGFLLQEVDHKNSPQENSLKGSTKKLVLL